MLGWDAAAISQMAVRAVEKIYRSLAPSLSGPPDGSDGALLPILNAYNPEGTTKYVDFPTTKTTLFATRPDRRHLNYVVYDRNWEVGLAERLEGMHEVFAYVKNHNIGFEVPYDFTGETPSYRPDYIARVDDGGPEPLNRHRGEGPARRERQGEGRDNAQSLGSRGQ